MNIALVLQHLNAAKGGAERFAIDLAGDMTRDGHEVDIYANTCGTVDEWMNFFPVKAVRTPRFLYELTFARNSAKILKRSRYDVVLGVNRTLSQDVFILPSATHLWYRQDLRSFSNPLHRFSHRLLRSMNVKHWLMFYLDRRIFQDREVKKVVAVSHMVKKEIVDRYRVPPEKVVVVHHGVDLEQFHPNNRKYFSREAGKALGLGEDDKVILFIGHNFRLKGLYPFVQVLSTLKKRGFSGFKGMVIGRGNIHPFLREAKRRGCADSIIFPGPQSDMKMVYAGGDLLLSPTFYDSFSLTTLEALASGLPVITTRLNGASELITDGREGYVVADPWEVERLADRVEALLDEDKLAASRVKARELAEKFPQNNYYRSLMEICGEVAGEKGET